MGNSITKNQAICAFETERRSQDDRRHRSTRAISRHSHRGKRQHIRRSKDLYPTNKGSGKGSSKGFYIDKYDPKMLFTILSILLLCLADAYMTTLIIAQGGEELNILMELLIKESIFMFIVGKYLLTSSGLIFLVAHRNFNICYGFKVTYALFGLLLIYIILIAYEISILTSENLLPFL